VTVPIANNNGAMQAVAPATADLVAQLKKTFEKQANVRVNITSVNTRPGLQWDADGDGGLRYPSAGNTAELDAILTDQQIAAVPGDYKVFIVNYITQAPATPANPNPGETRGISLQRQGQTACFIGTRDRLNPPFPALPSVDVLTAIAHEAFHLMDARGISIHNAQLNHLMVDDLNLKNQDVAPPVVEGWAAG